MEKTKKCENCGTFNKLGTVNCEECGSSLYPVNSVNEENDKYCENCGKKLDEDEKFCNNCGKSSEDNNKFNKKSKKFIILAIALIAIIAVGGYFAYSAYQTSQFDSHLKDAMINEAGSLYLIDKGWNEVDNSRYGAEYSIAKGTFMAAETFNINASKGLEKCKDFAQTSEEKQLIQILIEKNNLYNELINVNIESMDIAFNAKLDYFGTNREQNKNSIISLVDKSKEINRNLDLKSNELNELYTKYPHLKERANKIIESL